MTKESFKILCSAAMLNEMEQVTVIIPAYNEEDVIDDCLESLTAQTFSSFKAIIVDDQSTDRTFEKIKNFASRYPALIEYRQYGKVGPGRARNLAAKEAESTILAFMDADCIATPTWIEGLVKFYTDTSIASVGGPHLAPLQSSPFQKLVESFFLKSSVLGDFYKSSQAKVRNVAHNPLCNVSYRRDVFARVQGFREDLFPGEDVEIDFKVRDLGFKILYNSEAIVYHHRPENIQQFKNVMHAYGRAQGKLIREYGLRRRTQWAGAGTLLFLIIFCIGLVNAMALQGAVLAVILLGVFFYLRPNLDNRTGIFFNALQWFNGFVEGVITNRSLPPGYQNPNKR